MGAVVDTVETVDSIMKSAIPPQLAKYTFQVGHPPYRREDGTTGRPKGSLNAQTVLMKSAPKLARTYVKEALKGNATLLVDSRKWILPVDGDDSRSAPTQMIVFVGDGALPRALDLPPVVSQVETPSLSPSTIHGTPLLSVEHL